MSTTFLSSAVVTLRCTELHSVVLIDFFLPYGTGALVIPQIYASLEYGDGAGLE